MKEGPEKTLEDGFNALSSLTEPTRRLKSRLVTTWIIGTIVAGACAVWAFNSTLAPNTMEPMKVVEPTNRVLQTDDPVTALDKQAFAAKLWNPPPPEVPASPPTQQQRAVRPRLDFHLIGITTDDGRHTAALYDPKSDVLHLVADGESIGTLRVSSITDTYVELDDGHGPRRIDIIPASGTSGSSGESSS